MFKLMCVLPVGNFDAATAREQAQIVPPLRKCSSQSHSNTRYCLSSSLAAASSGEPMPEGFLRKALWVSSVAVNTATMCSPVANFLIFSSFVRVDVDTPGVNGLEPKSRCLYAPTRCVVTSSCLFSYAFTKTTMMAGTPSLVGQPAGGDTGALMLLRFTTRFRDLAATVPLRRGTTEAVAGHLWGSALDAPSSARRTGAVWLHTTSAVAFKFFFPITFFWRLCLDSRGFWLALAPGISDAL
mmetsp:Transcript_15234/g.30556  ORF Transcript_15234/g.30556 Transcript_15234/m.30556 type:complete len:241 (-) Transcript_15234:27-749(-)